jgi:hypothetical protein
MILRGTGYGDHDRNKRPPWAGTGPKTLCDTTCAVVPLLRVLGSG